LQYKFVSRSAETHMKGCDQFNFSFLSSSFLISLMNGLLKSAYHLRPKCNWHHFCWRTVR